VPGDTLTGLNFNPGAPGAIDNDFFVMAVRPGIAYTCRTYDLGPAVDTNLIAYNSANQSDLIGGSDDVDTQSGQINSRLTFTATKRAISTCWWATSTMTPTCGCRAAPPTR